MVIATLMALMMTHRHFVRRNQAIGGLSRFLSTAEVPKSRPRILSGIQPTGIPHLGNYFGALSNWVDLQNAGDSQCEHFYMVVDLHAITSPYEVETMGHRCRDTAATLLGCGINPSKSQIFVQSHVPGHAELAWLLGCMTSLGALDRMTQFKDKASKGGASQASLGLYSYPVLQAADILLYHSTAVPVGADQKQHLELCRDIATTFNHRFGPHFPLPEPLINDTTNRVMSLKDGRSKMSKSDPAEGSRINLTDDADTIRKKVRRAKTDEIPGFSYDVETRPEVSNLLSLLLAARRAGTGHAASTSTSAGGGGVPDGMQELCEELEAGGGGGMAHLKSTLVEALVETVCPIGDRVRRYQQDPAYLDEVLRDGADRAAVVAEETLEGVKHRMGLMPRGRRRV